MATKKWPISRIVEIHWKDACGRGGWGSVQEYMQHSTASVMTVGYLLKDESDQVTVCTSQGIDIDDVNQAISIPKAWVKSMKVLRK